MHFLAQIEPIIQIFFVLLRRFSNIAMETSREILQFLHYHPLSSREEIRVGIGFQESDATLKRLLASGIENGDIVVEGKARATRYSLSNRAHLLMPLNLDTYFAKDIDERQVQTSFNFDLISR